MLLQLARGSFVCILLAAVAALSFALLFLSHRVSELPCVRLSLAYALGSSGVISVNHSFGVSFYT